MLTNRHRGLAGLHHLLGILVVAVFFWIYSEVTMRYLFEWMRLSREVNLLPYFLSVLIGMVAGGGRVAKLGPRLPRLGGGEAAALAAQQVALVALVVFSMMFATQDRSISRLFLGTFLVWSWLLLVVLHLSLPRQLARISFGGYRVPTVFIGRVGAFPMFNEWLLRRREVGVEPVGFVSLDANGFRGSAPPASYLGNMDELPGVLERMHVAQVVMLEVPPDAAVARSIINLCQEHGCRLLVHHDMDAKFEHPLMIVEEDGRQFLTLHEEPLEEPLNRMVKRAFDILVALPIVALVLPPLCALVWIVQRFQSPGPLFHVRPRSGERRTAFEMVKFRTMDEVFADEAAEAKQARPDDKRVYPLGRLLRRHSLDEFPQFWNVLVGEMSIVGPRPVMPLLDEEFERQVKSYRSKHWVKPGITGLAQSEGFRGEITTPEQLKERIRLDLYYIAHWSFWLDVQISLKTFWQIFVPPKSAY